MNAAKHTPGPWKIVHPRFIGCDVEITAGFRRRVCTLPGRAGGAEQELEATARLIKEAPAMLEALRRAINFATDDDVQNWDDKTIRMVRAILRRIDGAA